MLSEKQKKIASKAGDPNKIDAKDFAVLKAEKAKGRGMGLEDEKLKPGKEYVEKAKGGMTKGQKKVGKVMREFKEGKLKSSSGKKVTNPKQAIAIGLSEAGMSKPKKAMGGGMMMQEPIMADEGEFVKRRKALGGTKILSTVLSSTPVGRVAKGIGALAGVGAAAKVSSDMSSDESYKEGMEEGKTMGSTLKERVKKQMGKTVGVARGIIGKKSGGYVRGGRREIKGLRPAKLF